MNNVKMSEEMTNIFLDDLLKDNFTYPNHKFSLRYKLKKSRIIKKYKREHPTRNVETTSFGETKIRIPLKYSLKYILIIIILMAILGFTLYRYYSGIYIREYDIFSMLSVEYDENSPLFLNERFYIDMDMDEYEEEIICDNEVSYWVQYKVNGIPQINITQTAIQSSNLRINTEKAMIMPTNISVNDWKGMYYQAYDGAYIYFFNCGDYLMSYAGNLDKNEMEKLVKSTKFA